MTLENAGPVGNTAPVGTMGGSFVSRLVVEPDAPDSGYPFSLPVVRALRAANGLTLKPGATFLVGENGVGKSTLVEALAFALGLNPEGGSRSFNFATHSSDSAQSLGSYLRLTRSPGRERSSFFLRAESYFNVATEIERLGGNSDPSLLAAYGGTSPHERSHGQAFLDLLNHRFRPRGLYVLDEPEAALSPTGCLAALARMHDLVHSGTQFIIATHSPILISLPNATILQIDCDGAIRGVVYDDCEMVRIMRNFLTEPGRVLKHLLE